jgi:hypothetical protein
VRAESCCRCRLLSVSTRPGTSRCTSLSFLPSLLEEAPLDVSHVSLSQVPAVVDVWSTDADASVPKAVRRQERDGSGGASSVRGRLYCTRVYACTCAPVVLSCNSPVLARCPWCARVCSSTQVDVALSLVRDIRERPEYVLCTVIPTSMLPMEPQFPTSALMLGSGYNRAMTVTPPELAVAAPPAPPVPHGAAASWSRTGAAQPSGAPSHLPLLALLASNSAHSGGGSGSGAGGGGGGGSGTGGTGSCSDVAAAAAGAGAGAACFDGTEDAGQAVPSAIFVGEWDQPDRDGLMPSALLPLDGIKPAAAPDGTEAVVDVDWLDLQSAFSYFDVNGLGF